jgi:riboflavin biosynthesis pyrimidine reductase
MIRAISDVIIVGYKTVALDNPELTTRFVKGPSPMRIIIDKDNRLSNKYNVFKNSDSNGYKIIGDKIKTNEDNIFQLPLDKGRFNEQDIILLLSKLRKKVIFIEGGGATVSDFYNRNILNRLHLCISSSILGKGRPSFITKTKQSLDEAKCHKTKYSQMGQDILCDIKLS